MHLLLAHMITTTPTGTISLTIPVDATAARQSLWAPIGGGRLASRSPPSPPASTRWRFHDENSNGKFDLGLFGIPLEGSVASNDARGRFGAPSFRDAKFTFDGRPLELRLAMRY